MADTLPMFRNGTIVTACAIFNEIQTNAELESFILEYDLTDQVAPGSSRANTILNLKRFAVHNPEHKVITDHGEQRLAAVIVDKAIHILRKEKTDPRLEKLERYLNLDGYALTFDKVEGYYGDESELSGFTVSMPDFARLPESSSEVDVLLGANGFEIPKRHLDSAKENITQGDWEAANSQCRTFLEALTDSIADDLYGAEATTIKGGLEKRQLLAKKGFLSCEKHEFSNGNGQAFLPGLAKLLHSEGAHPGISNQPDSLFRLQIVVVTARWLLKRLEISKNTHI